MAVDRDALREKLAAPNIRIALQRAGMFLTGWELLQSDILEGVRGFFELSPGVVSPEYQLEVLDRDKYPFEASLQWLVAQGAVTTAEAARVRSFRAHRNEIAHELPKLLVDPQHNIDTTMLADMAAILRSIGVFWGRIAIETNGDFDGKDVKDDDIRSGATVLMAHLVTACESLEAR